LISLARGVKGGVQWRVCVGRVTLAGDLWESLSCSQSTVVVHLWQRNLNKASFRGAHRGTAKLD
jgi:hypothetical protein